MTKYYVTIGSRQVLILAETYLEAAVKAYRRFFDGIITTEEALKSCVYTIGEHFRVSESGFEHKDSDEIIQTKLVIYMITRSEKKRNENRRP
jgi:hypothetical protein